MCLWQIRIDCNISISKSQKFFSELLNFRHLLSSNSQPYGWQVHLPNLLTYRRSLPTLANIRSFEILLLGHFWQPFPLRCSAGSSILGRYRRTFLKIYCLIQAAPITKTFRCDFVLWEALGTLPSLASFTLRATYPESHLAYAPEDLSSQSWVSGVLTLQEVYALSFSSNISSV